MRSAQLTAILVLSTLSISLFAETRFIQELRFQSPGPDNCASISLDDEDWPVIQLADLPQNQAICLRGYITIEAEILGANTDISLSILAASRLYWDGQLLASNGRVGTDRASEIPGLIDFTTALPNALLGPGQHQIALQISSFHLDETLSEIFYGLRIIDSQQLHNYLMRSSWLAIFSMGGLLVIGLLFQLFYWIYQRRALYQVFSLLCFCAAILLLIEKSRFMFGISYDWQTSRFHGLMLIMMVSCLLLPSFYLLYYKLARAAVWLLSLASALMGIVLFVGQWGYDGKAIALFFASLLTCFIINCIALFKQLHGARANTFIIATGMLMFARAPIAFTEDLFSITLFGIVLVILISLIHEMRHNRRQSLASVRLEAELLKRNLQPHFLMNSLMLVIEWIEQKPDAAASFVHALSDELRMLVKFSGQAEIPLEDEIALCRRHIEIMAYRYKANYALEVTGSAQGIIVPPAILHTQIENTFTHNRVPISAVFRLDIHRGKQIQLDLSSPFQLKRKTEGGGLGDRYIRARLTEKFGKNYHYESGARDERWLSSIAFGPSTESSA